MVFSLVILNYNTRELLKQCLRGINSLGLANLFPYEIIVVDNNSNDGSYELVKNQFSEVKLIRSNKNLGHAAGNNMGIRAAAGKYICLLNTDIIFLANPFGRIHEFLENHPAVGVLGPKLLNPNKTIQESCYGFYNHLTPVYRRTIIGQTRWGQEDIRRFLISDWDRTDSRAVDWVISSFMVLRASAVAQVGLMDERYFMYFPDTEYCKRFAANGHQVYYLADVPAVVHYYRKQSADRSGIISLLDQTTRVHLKDWFKYLLYA